MSPSPPLTHPTQLFASCLLPLASCLSPLASCLLPLASCLFQQFVCLKPRYKRAYVQLLQ
ncbi:hypothetical protein [Moorena sp. SIO4G3]|uniref:hypothetical protein n=1 Tax=Moorena sp. SIO4G3 TaxID=2607821 RepID=UPI00142B036B|nr:hypothetical protein [Moorena sp. SIO4G3]NEO75579.1 hypothetical protein [Moorena sp. SIO4G3]